MSNIEWTDRTWNPVRGCSRVSAGCDNCYAMGQAHRFSGAGKPYDGLTTIRRGKVEQLGAPLKWKKPARVFVNSMSDLFHESLSNEEIAAVFGVMAACPQHTFQVLTKRPKRMREWFERTNQLGAIDRLACVADDALEAACVPRAARALAFAPGRGAKVWPLTNVWLGVSVEDQRAADERIPLLLRTPAAVRFVSAEPLLGPLNLNELTTYSVGATRRQENALRGTGIEYSSNGSAGWWFTKKLDWVIVGGESGTGARHCDVEWIRSIVRQCRAAEVPVFVKQLGSLAIDNSQINFGADPPSDSPLLNTLDRKGGDPTEWPKDLRVREFPR